MKHGEEFNQRTFIQDNMGIGSGRGEGRAEWGKGEKAGATVTA